MQRSYLSRRFRNYSILRRFIFEKINFHPLVEDELSAVNEQARVEDSNERVKFIGRRTGTRRRTIAELRPRSGDDVAKFVSPLQPASVRFIEIIFIKCNQRVYFPREGRRSVE